MFGNCNGFLSKAMVAACMYFLVYMQKSNGDKIAPCGTPWVIGRAADKDEPMRTF
jgi:hypothetical protein